MILKTIRNSILFMTPVMLLAVVSCSEPPEVNEITQHRIIIEDKELDFGDQILYLIIALEMYRSHVGQYPSEALGLNALIEKPEEQEVSQKWNGPYADTTELFYDPWKRPLSYKIVDGVIDLRSLGKDGEPSSDDMIASEMYPDVFREMRKLSEAGMIQTGELEPPPQEQQ